MEKPDHSLNETQSYIMQVLQSVIGILDELKVPYYMQGGTMLGAIRHRGFIPWDDDVDVAMPREDYEIFIKEAPKLLSEHLFLQNYHTEPYYPLLMSKIRNSNTTFIEPLLSKIPMHHGVYIDIFPLDGYPGDRILQERIEREKYRYIYRDSC